MENTETKMEEYLVLLARFGSSFVEQELIPEIEKNCKQFGIFSQTAYDVFQKNKFAANSLYFHHEYAVTDIPIGQEYEAIAYSRDWKIQPDSIQKCSSKVLCFFTAFRTQPSDHAMRGHHELSLIQFGQGVPSMINELFEITECKPLDTPEHRYIYLGSETVLRKLVRKQEATAAAAELLKGFDIRDEEEFSQDKEKSSAIYEMMKKLTVEKYELEEGYVKEILSSGLYELRRKFSKVYAEKRK